MSLVERSRDGKRSIKPDDPLPARTAPLHAETRVQVSNETTLLAARRLVRQGHPTIALNFANGVHPGGGFLSGARAQEEVLCRSSALHSTLVDDPMYTYHCSRPEPDSSGWVIYSPGVPIFRTDNGDPVNEPWPLSVLTSAAPYAPSIGQARASHLLRQRIHRVLAVASAFNYPAIVLGAWGCGAFGNDVNQTALDFREALHGSFAGHFAEVLFAVSDWSPERRFLGPFRDAFA
jgi:uncharacterized protein (TIGR02452 family)